MTKYYVKPDTDGKFPDKDTAPALEMADGLVEVSIPTTSIQYFTRYWWMYALLDNGGVQAPGNLPDLSIDGLQSIINQQGAQLDNALGTIKTQKTTIEGMQKALGESTKAQVEAQKTFTETTTQFQQQFGEIAKGQVELGKQIQALATK